nr:DUF6571 family protein [Actinomyces ruminis]
MIQNIRNLADDCDAAKSRIDSEFEAENDPMTIDDFPSAADKVIGNLNGRADTLEEAKNAIVAVNESGVGSMNADGVISCDIPDSVSINNVPQLVSWSEGAIDAHDLQNIVETGRKSNGRDYDQVIESMREHADDSVYANAFIDIVGPENLTQLPLNLESMPYGSGYLVSDEYIQPLGPNEANELAELEGMFLASASKGWDDEQCASVAKAISGSVDEEDELGGITVLNAMLDGHDENGDHINDLDFNDAFLTSLANRLDDINWDPNETPSGRYLSGHSLDPMAGVLDAMGNSPEAALDYLVRVPGGSGGLDVSKFEELSTREWDEQGLSGFTAATAAASSLRSSETPSERARAQFVADNSIHLLAVNTDESMYDDDAKARIGLLLGNCPGELTSAWNKTGDLKDVMQPEMQLTAASVEDVNILAYRVADSSDAMSNIFSGLVDYAHTRGMSNAQEKHDGVPEQQLKDIKDAYGDASEATGALVGIAKRKAANASADNLRSYGVKTAVATGALGVVLWPLGFAGSLVTGAAGVYFALAAPGSEGDGASAVGSNVEDLIWASALQDASQLGILDQDVYTYDGSNDDYDWIVHDPEGNYSIMLGGSGSGSEALGQMHAWSRGVAENLGDQTMNDLEDNVGMRYTNGERYVTDREEIPGYVEPAVEMTTSNGAGRF